MYDKIATQKKSFVTWILIADGKEARIYAREKADRQIPLPGNAKHPHFAESSEDTLAPVPGMRWEAESSKVYDIDPQQLGRVQESASPTRHSSAPHVDVHEEVKFRFARALAEQLNAAAAKRDFDRLALVAPPKMLGEIKKHLHGNATRRIVAELPKELTHFEGEELAKHLKEIA